MKPLSIGIDIGGTKTAFGFITGRGEILSRHEIQTGNSNTPHDLIDRIYNVVMPDFDKYKNSYSISGIGIGVPNGNFFKGTVEYAPNLVWKGIVPLAEMFRNKFSTPVYLTNDANAAALGEMHFGAAKKMKDFIFITLGTGLGSGIVVGGKLIYGHDGFAGELGHTVIIRHGRQCGCGRRGCLEQYCSATGIVKTYYEILETSGQKINSEKEIDAKYIFEKALAGDEAAFYAFNYTGELLGFALANSVTYTNPEAIFLFGGLANAGELLFNPVQASFAKNVMRIFKNTKILPSGLAESNAPLLGAASLVWSEMNLN